MKPFLKKTTLFVLLPLFVGQVYLFFAPFDLKWYSNADRTPASAKDGKVFFVGSSRVEGGIIPSEITKVLKESYNLEPAVHNLGRGGTNLGTHYLAIASKLKSDPEALRGSVVLIELLFGLPDRLTWHDDWIVSAELTGPFIKPNYLPKVFSARTSNLIKSQLVVGSIVTGTLLIPRMHAFVTQRGELLVSQVFRRLRALIYPERAEMHEQAVMQSGGTIRTDDAGIRHHRTFILNLSEKLVAEAPFQKPVTDWEQTIMHDLVRLVEGAGGKPVFFETYSSSYMRKPYLFPAALADNESFKKIIQKWNTPLLSFPFNYTDDDFPDLSHLRITRAGEYSRLVAHQVAKQILRVRQLTSRSDSF